MDQRIIDLYDEFVHVHFNRRLFIERAAKLVGGTAAAMALMPMLQSNYALAAMIDPADKRLKTEHVTFNGASGPVKAYLAEPKSVKKAGAIIVIHQNRGLNPHIEDVARRWAVKGYVVLAPDFLSPLGGTPTDEDKAMQMFSQLKATDASANAKAAGAWLRSRPEVNGKVGAVGFCWGGGVVNQLAVDDPMLAAGDVYYGAPPADLAGVANIKAPLLLNYADPKLDTRLGGMYPAYVDALKAAHKKYELHTYDGANHAFNDDTQQARYNKAAADLAWKRSEAFFAKNLKA